MRAYERLIKYASTDTKSSFTSGAHPSTDSQFTLARDLAAELTALGATDVTVTDKCYVYAKLPATEGCEGAARLGLIAHMDTSPDFSGAGVNPVIHENYTGEALALGDSGRVLDPSVFPHLASLAGKTLITTDGKTLLGADDKAGIAEIVTLAEELSTSKTPHGDILIAFTPDEEIGEGADFFDVGSFGADFAYTVDGGREGSLEYENFNAASADVSFVGRGVHPGSAKGVMINASLVAMQFNAALPSFDIPAATEGYEGFFHLTDMEGTVENASLSYIVRDHASDRFEARLATMKHIASSLNEQYGEGTVELKITESYRNMKEKILPQIHLIDNAIAAIEAAGIAPSVEPIRGGTDGARLSFMGLPCPNLGTGGFAFHGPFEHITVEGMDKTVEILKNIVGIYAKRPRI